MRQRHRKLLKLKTGTSGLAPSKGRSSKIYEDVSLDDKGHSTELFGKLANLMLILLIYLAPNILMVNFKISEIPRYGGLVVQMKLIASIK